MGFIAKTAGLVALFAALFAGWSAYEAHRTRVDGDETSRRQALELVRARKAAEENARATADLASTNSRSARANIYPTEMVDEIVDGPNLDQERRLYTMTLKNLGSGSALDLKMTFG
jgi:predicted negative regulator of RcsB-dependent stress response